LRAAHLGSVTLGLKCQHQKLLLKAGIRFGDYSCQYMTYANYWPIDSTDRLVRTRISSLGIRTYCEQIRRPGICWGMHTSSPLDTLRQQVARITGFTRRAEAKPLGFGISELDGITPWGGLARGGIHELIGDQAAITGLLAVLLGRQKGLEQVIWVTPDGYLFAPGLSPSLAWTTTS